MSRARLAPSLCAVRTGASLGGDPKLSTLHKWYRALEGAGVEFIDESVELGPGVRLQKGKPQRRGSDERWIASQRSNSWTCQTCGSMHSRSQDAKRHWLDKHHGESDHRGAEDKREGKAASKSK